MNRALCSIGAVIGKANGLDFSLLRQCSERLECDGFELMLYSGVYDRLDEIKDIISELSLCIPVFHADKRVGEHISLNGEGDVEKAAELFEINCETAKAAGSEKLVLHLWNGLASDRDIENNIRCYKPLRKISDRYGLLLTVENVVCNIADPMTHMRSLLSAYPDIAFTFDTKMAAFHSQLEQLYGEENRDIYNSCVHMHINDYKGGHKDWTNLKTLHLGEGNIDFDRFFEFIRRMGYKGDFTVEATAVGQNGEIDFDALNRDFEYIRNKISL